MIDNQLEEFTLKDLILLFWSKKFFILSVTLLFAICSIYYSLSLQNKYTSSALLIANQSENSSVGGLSQFAGVASLAGISLPGESADRSIEAIEKINSFEFFNNHFLPYINLENLLAVRKWEHETNKILYHEDIFNSEKNTWVREVSYPKKTKPSPQEAYKTYKILLNVNQDPKTSFVYLDVTHNSPFIAKKWAELIISQININISMDDKNTALNAIEFLNKQLLKVNYEEIRISISKLQEEQMKSLMLIEANKDYIFRKLDSPIAPELKSSPNRALICFLITLFGFISSLLAVVLRHHRIH